MTTHAKLSGRVAFVTGGGRGLGRDIARHLADQGARVFITGRDRDALAETVQSLPSCDYAVADVTDEAAMKAAVARCVAQLGPVDILVNNAGMSLDGPIADADTDAWWRVMEVNVKGPLILSRMVLPGMIARGQGHIINLGSYVATAPGPMVSAYATSKTALLRLTDSLAEELKDSGVVVIALSPGLVFTDMGHAYEQAMKTRVDGFEGFSQQYIFDPSAIAQLICRVAAGDADAFAGRMLHVKDDLDALITSTEQILDQGRFLLQFKSSD